MLGAGPRRQDSRVFRRSVQDADRTHPAPAQVLHRHGRHLARSHDHDPAVRQSLQLGLREVGTQGDEGVGSRPDGRLVPDAAPSPGRRMEEAGQRGVGRVFALGASQRFANLRVDLRFAQHHGIEPARHLEQMIGGLPFPVGVQGFGQLVGVDTARLDQEPLQRHEACVVGGDIAVDLHAVAGGQDHHPVEPVQLVRAPVGLGEVVVAEGEPLQQLDRRVTERDPEGEDGHEQVRHRV